MPNALLPVFKTRCSATQRKFVQLYIQYGKDHVKAYVDSRDRPPAMEGKELKAKANGYLRNTTIRKMLDEMNANALANIEIKNQSGMATVIEQYSITKERIMAELAKIAFASPGDVMVWGPDGVTVKSSDELTSDQLAAIGEVYDAGGGEKGSNVRIKLLNKQEALINLGKELGMFSQKVEHKGQVAVAAKFIIEGK